MKMFDLFDSTSEGYIPDNSHTSIKFEINKNLTDSLTSFWPLLNAKGELLGLEWNYGNPVEIPFEISGNIIDDSELVILNIWDFLLDTNITVQFYDHFYNKEVEFETTIDDFATTETSIIYTLPISKQISEKLLPGTHHVRIVLSGYDVELYNSQDSILNVR